MTQRIIIQQPGGPEVLAVESISHGKPAAGEVLVRQTAVGVNFIDIYHRTGLYKLPAYPSGIGMEAAGVVADVGQGVTLKAGDRVAYCGGALGAYAYERIVPESQLIKLPNGISDEMAAAAMVKGLTTCYLLRRTFRVEKGHSVLIHAAAGGVGLLLCQWAKHLGATVIGTVSTEGKAALAKKNGCDHTILYTNGDIAEQVRELTQGKGVEVVYDSVGKNTFTASLDSLKKFGVLVSYGNASGPVDPFSPLLLSQKGSLYITRPTLMHHMEDNAVYRSMADELFGLIGQGVLNVHIGGRYALTDAAQAQTDLEARKTTGSIILIP